MTPEITDFYTHHRTLSVNLILYYVIWYKIRRIKCSISVFQGWSTKKREKTQKREALKFPVESEQEEQEEQEEFEEQEDLEVQEQ